MVLLEELPEYQRINVRVKVMHMEDVTELHSGERGRKSLYQMPLGNSNLLFGGTPWSSMWLQKRLSTAKENCTIVSGFEKTRLPRTSDFPTLMQSNFIRKCANDLKLLHRGVESYRNHMLKFQTYSFLTL